MVELPRKRLKSSQLRRRQKRSEGEAEQRASLSARRVMVVQVLEERTYPLMAGQVQKRARQVWLVEKVLRVFWDPLSANPVTHPMALLMKASVEFLVKEFVEEEEEEDLVEQDLKEEVVPQHLRVLLRVLVLVAHPPLRVTRPPLRVARQAACTPQRVQLRQAPKLKVQNEWVHNISPTCCFPNLPSTIP